jgi:2-polyprenyl-3-methyl-5-hydroxy-6-metoxy-1,4-benzoquinol methylase
VCNSTATELYKERSIQRALVPEDVAITDARYGVTLGLRRCKECGFVFADDADLDELLSLYERLEDSSYEATQDTRRLQMRWLLQRARRLHPRATTLLDVGAGAGLLVAEARRMGYEAVGVEPSRRLVEIARRVHQVDLLQGTYPHPAIEGRKFDLIFLVDVVEHVVRPLELIRACRSSLALGGVLLVITPDIGSLTARFLRHRWWHLRLAHIGYFNRRSMMRTAECSGLAVVDRCRPTWYFRTEYIAQRLVQYLPMGWLNHLAGRVGLLRRLYRTTIPVNPQDSMFVALRKAA